VERFAVEATRAIGCPLDFVGLPILAAAGGAIGASRAVEIKAQWVQRPLLYAAAVGPAGDGKTPALDLVCKPIYEAQAANKAKFENELEEYERKMAEYQEAKRARKRKEDPEGPEPVPPEKPHLHRVLVDDATVESLAPILETNQRGVLMVRDELSAWVTSLNQYKGGNGSDRQFWLKNWTSTTAAVDRKGSPAPIMIAHPFVAVVGCIPPDMLAALRDEKGRSDGFLDRVLFAYPEPTRAPDWTWDEVPDETLGPWRAILGDLLKLTMRPGDHGPRPEYLRLTPDARDAWECQFQALVTDQNRPDFPPVLRGPWSKFKVYLARLALIVQVLRWITRETGEKKVEAESVRRAGRLVTYFQSHARRVYATIGADPEIEDARRVLGWIEREGRASFKRWEVFNDLKSQGRFPRVEDLDRPLGRLAKHGYIRQQPPPERNGKPGRPPDVAFDVNPFIRQSHGNHANQGN
jgi:hypothetical protein